MMLEPNDLEQDCTNNWRARRAKVEKEAAHAANVARERAIPRDQAGHPINLRKAEPRERADLA
jgi:hypothetical protein